MAKRISDIPIEVLNRFRRGCVIPAQPLALDSGRNFSPRHQRALCRYHIDCGVGGVAVGASFSGGAAGSIEINFYRTVMGAASVFLNEWAEKRNRCILKIAGVGGSVLQQKAEAQFAETAGYDAVLLGVGDDSEISETELLEHVCMIAETIPVIGVYLPHIFGGRQLSLDFWRAFCKLDNLLAIQIAPFDRYRTLDVVRAVAEAGGDVTLYTGNVDSMIPDLLTEYHIPVKGGVRKIRMKGGLSGCWSVWAKKAVELLEQIQKAVAMGKNEIPVELFVRSAMLTDCSGAIYDAANNFCGQIAGIHEILRRQGLLPGPGIWCFDPEKRLSPGQIEEIDRVYRSYPALNDDGFVFTHLREWFAD